MSNASDIIHSTNDDTSYIRRKLIEFNSENVPNGRYEECNLCMKDQDGLIIAGINSAICWNWMEIDILWVDVNHRGRGLGKRMLEKAEQIAKSKNCSFIKLNTFSFQAPDFYKKFGYEVMAIIENAPVGSNHYYFKKELA